MNFDTLKAIIDCLYSDFDWYGGKFNKKEMKRFLRYVKELQAELGK